MQAQNPPPPPPPTPTLEGRNVSEVPTMDHLYCIRQYIQIGCCSRRLKFREPLTTGVGEHLTMCVYTENDTLYVYSVSTVLSLDGTFGRPLFNFGC